MKGDERTNTVLLKDPVGLACGHHALKKLVHPYRVAMDAVQVDEFLRRFAPDDVRATIVWLSAHGYKLRSHSGESTFGAQFVYRAAAEVRITVDRSQWMLDVASRPGGEAWQYDLLVAVQVDRPYDRVFPQVGVRSPGQPLPEQLPEGVSWHDSLPGLLGWLENQGTEVQVALDRARDERNRLMWPSGRGG